MKKEMSMLEIVQTALGTFRHRQSFTPGMFEPLKPLFEKLGYTAAAVYIADDYPDRMGRVSSYGADEIFPSYIIKNRKPTLHEELKNALAGNRGILTGQLFSHGRELGAFAAAVKNSGRRHTREAFDILLHALSIMAYVERIRTNSSREREERDVFFAQSLTSRLLLRPLPEIPGLRLGYEFIRSLEAGGDFFNFIPARGGGLLGIVGSCSGKGLRTVLEMCQLYGTVSNAAHGAEHLAGVLRDVNTYLVKEKRRANQASLCLFHIDTKRKKIRTAKAGRLGMLLCGPKAAVSNISAAGGSFLGMVENPDIREETYDFKPGHSLFCVTEGIYSSRNVLNAKPQFHWFLEAMRTTLETELKEPLANAIFAALDSAADYATRPSNSMLAVSAEFIGKSS